MVPVIYSIAIEIRLADFSPIFAWVRRGVGVLPQTLSHRRTEYIIAAFVPSWINRPQCTVNCVAEFMHGNTFIVVAINRPMKKILLAEACWPSAGAAHSLILVSRIGMITVLGHVC